MDAIEAFKVISAKDELLFSKYCIALTLLLHELPIFLKDYID